MKTTRALVTMMVGTVSAAFAASGVQGQELGLLIYLFIAFFSPDCYHSVGADGDTFYWDDQRRVCALAEDFGV